MMQGKITYYQQVTYCGKPQCRRCREGIGHGPYWYAYQVIDGRTARRYIGKNLPPDVQPSSLATSGPYVAVEAGASSSVPPSLSSSMTSSLVASPSAVTESPPQAAVPSSATPAGEGFGTLSSAACVLRIRTCGRFLLEQRAHGQKGQHASSPLWVLVTGARWQRQPVRLLLGYLLTQPGREIDVAQASSVLWPQLAEKAARTQLLQSIKTLRQVLERPGVKSDTDAATNLSELLHFDGRRLTLAGQDLIWVDIDEFAAIEHRLDAAGRALSSDDYETLLRHAMTLVRGDFLPELSSLGWVQRRATQIRTQWSLLSLHLAEHSRAHGQDASALATLNSLLQVNPLYEAAVQMAMAILLQQQRRPEAITIYRNFTRALRQQMHREPARETQDLYETLRTGAQPASSSLSSSTRTAPSTTSGATDTSAARRTSNPNVDVIGRANQSILVGRENELTFMRSMLYDIRETARLQLVGSRHPGDIPLDTQRQPQFLLLHGVAGIGKTRLAEEIAREAQGNGWTVVWSRQYEQESGIPYRIWTDALRKLFTQERDFDIFASLSDAAIHALATLPGLIDVLPFERLEETPAPQVFSPENAQFRLYSVICELLKSISLRHPLLLVLDDIQYSDVSSHQLLGHLARQLTGYPVALFSTCRDNDHNRDYSQHLRKLILEMKREHTIREMGISPLSTEQIEQLITSLSSLPEESVRLIQDRAAGNPFFAEELTRWSFTPNVPLPQTVSDALRYRMESLSGECLDLLKHAAILGGSFDYSVICLMENEQQFRDDDRVISLLEEAQDADVVLEEASGPHIVYHFWHPLAASYLYEQMSAIRRTRWHKKAAQALLALYAGREEEVAAQAVLHLDKADADPMQIAYYAELAADNAFVLPAYAEAVLYYQKAIDCLASLPLQPDAQSRLLDLLERLAECLKNSGSYEKAIDTYMRLLSLRAQSQSDSANEKADDDASRDVQVQALLWEEICWAWRYRGDIQQAWSCCQRGEAILHEAGIEAGPARARLYYTRSNLYLSEGQFEQALHYAQEALALLPEPPASAAPAAADPDLARHAGTSGALTHDRRRGKTSIQRTLDGDPVNLCRLHRHLGVIAVVNGHLQQALGHQMTALESFEQYNELRQVGNILSNIGYIQLKMGQYQQAQNSLQRALDLAQRIGDGPLSSLVLSNQGELNAATERFAEAEKAYRRALKLNETFGDREYMSRWNAGLAAVLLEEGRLRDSAKLIRQSLLVARVMKNQPCIGQALMILGRLRIAQAQILSAGSQRKRLLALAQRDIRRALALKVETETRLKGEMALAHIAYEQGAIAEAQTACERIIVAAQDYTLIVAEARQLQASLPQLS